jgi:hypothetical protein
MRLGLLSTILGLLLHPLQPRLDVPPTPLQILILLPNRRILRLQVILLQLRIDPRQILLREPIGVDLQHRPAFPLQFVHEECVVLDERLRAALHFGELVEELADHLLLGQAAVVVGREQRVEVLQLTGFEVERQGGLAEVLQLLQQVLRCDPELLLQYQELLAQAGVHGVEDGHLSITALELLHQVFLLRAQLDLLRQALVVELAQHCLFLVTGVAGQHI